MWNQNPIVKMAGHSAKWSRNWISCRILQMASETQLTRGTSGGGRNLGSGNSGGGGKPRPHGGGSTGGCCHGSGGAGRGTTGRSKNLNNTTNMRR